MKAIAPTNNAAQWPRHAVKSVECRKRDLVIRITDWTRDKEEPGWDVEVYIGGVYDWDQSEAFTKHQHGTNKAAKVAAIAFARDKVADLL